MNAPFYSGLHALRAVAALLVVFQHAYFTACISGGVSYANEFPINYGRIGVVLFFSISGFVIALNRTRPIREFAVHRLLRIYPGYWLAIMLTLPLLYYTAHRAHVSLGAIMLWPATHESDLKIPYWTLVFEIVFYVVAICLFSARFSDRILTVLMAAWIVIINLVRSNPADSTEFSFPGYGIVFSPIMQVLPMGFLCALHFGRLSKVPRLVLFITASVAYGVSFYFPDFTVQRHLFLGICTTLCVGAVADINPKVNFLKTMGHASYGIYLLHFPVILFIAWYIPPMPLVWATALFMTVGSCLGTLFGILDYRIYRHNTKREPES